MCSENHLPRFTFIEFASFIADEETLNTVIIFIGFLKQKVQRKEKS